MEILIGWAIRDDRIIAAWMAHNNNQSILAWESIAIPQLPAENSITGLMEAGMDEMTTCSNESV
jgi:hypothetical protein